MRIALCYSRLGQDVDLSRQSVSEVPLLQRNFCILDLYFPKDDTSRHPKISLSFRLFCFDTSFDSTGN